MIPRWLKLKIDRRESAFEAASTGKAIFDRRGGCLEVVPMIEAHGIFDQILKDYNDLVSQGFDRGSEEAKHAIKLLQHAEDCAHAIAKAYDNRASDWLTRAQRRIAATEAMKKHWNVK